MGKILVEKHQVLWCKRAKPCFKAPRDFSTVQVSSVREWRGKATWLLSKESAVWNVLRHSMNSMTMVLRPLQIAQLGGGWSSALFLGACEKPCQWCCMPYAGVRHVWTMLRATSPAWDLGKSQVIQSQRKKQVEDVRCMSRKIHKHLITLVYYAKHCQNSDFDPETKLHCWQFHIQKQLTTLRTQFFPRNQVPENFPHDQPPSSFLPQRFFYTIFTYSLPIWWLYLWEPWMNL